VNFNKILEEVPSPKIESIVLEKPKFGRAIQPGSNIKKNYFITKIISFLIKLLKLKKTLSKQTITTKTLKQMKLKSDRFLLK
jgi:hypothetical protein